MRTLVGLVMAGALAFCVGAQDPDTAKKKADEPKKKEVRKAPEITLKVGDAAPAIKADKWMQCPEIKDLKPGNVYVMEFWATWCGPCIVMMPHLSELHEQYKNKGVVIVGFTSKDPNNSEKKVDEFIKKRGPKLGYGFAYADNRDTHEAWMRAAGQNGIPCTFVVGKDGKIAYIGHPMFLDAVLPRVVSGAWKLPEDLERIEVLKKEYSEASRALAGANAEEGLKKFAEFEAKYPEMTKIPYAQGPKLRAMIKTGKTEDAKAFATKLIAGAAKTDDEGMINTVASTLIGPGAKDNPDLVKLAKDAAQKLVGMVGENDPRGQMTLALVLFADGDKDKAKTVAEKAVELAPENAREFYKDRLADVLGIERKAKLKAVPLTPQKKVEKKGDGN
jgi:thiol-disulfide isomerase/thioredoxin